ncbi:MAG TPA: alpha/beta hydrolase domain-containing protein, partial [Novosphingobium sp.]|nr:alpha/beta hydrolase domain-containing protein [Novosphingobium sp.]
GANPNIAARQVPLNIRFAVPGGAATLFEPGSEGTLWWVPYDDTARGRGRHGLLDRCTATHTCPLVMETFGSAELWGLRLSPALVGTDARADVPLPAGVRRYYFPGVTHGGSVVGGISLDGDKPWPGAPTCVLPNNPNPSLPTMRALLKRLVVWVKDGTPPPPSQYPTLAHGDLVAPTARAMGWPAIPGAPVPDGKINAFLDYDFGPGFAYADLSGVIERQPPAIRGPLPSLVPRVDGDGNELGGGVPSVQHLVPLGTYLGWNVLARGYGAGGNCGFAGGFIPFARTRAERLAKGDPRPSLQERYGSHEGFVAKVRAVAARRVREGWLLPDDAARLVAEAQASTVLAAP